MRRDLETSGNGAVSVEISDTNIVVGRRYCMTVIYTAGKQGVSVGGSLRFRLPGLDLKGSDVAPVSCSNPRAELRCSNRLPQVNGKNGSEFFTINYLFATVQETPLKEGDTVSVLYGSNIGLRHMAAPQMAQRWKVEVATDLDGTRNAPGSGFYLVQNAPELNFVSDKAFYAEVTIPSSTRAGVPFETVVRLRDKYHNIATDYTGTITLAKGSFENPTILGKYIFTADDRGVHTFANTVFDKIGVNRIIAIDEGAAIYARSNPSRITCGEPSPYDLFWGDTHCHSRFSADSAANNCFIPRPEGDYDYARNKSDLDFCMVVDHIEDQSADEWKETCEAARKACEPGRFVTFSGFEATFQPSRRNGDKNVYFYYDEEKWFNKDTTEELYKNLKQRKTKVMVIPHMHARTNWDLHDPELEKVVEIYAHWGCGLSPDSSPPMIPGNKRPEETYVSHALEQGAKLGFIASADHSYGHPGDDFWWGLSNYNGGLAAVYASSLTRDGIWNGLWNRRCYATTRARILLEFEINGHVMGEEFTVKLGEQKTRCLTINVYGTSPIQEVDIIKNSRTLESRTGLGNLDVEFSCDDPVTERETDYYYVHVTQVDGEQAWSSPIWVTVRQ